MRRPWEACIVVELNDLLCGRYDVEPVDYFVIPVLLCGHASSRVVHLGGFKAGTAETSIR